MIETPEEAKKTIKKWLVDSGHSIREIKDDTANFNFEIDFPPKQQSKANIVNPKEVTDLIGIIKNIKISPVHLTGLQKMKPQSRKNFIQEIASELLFKDSDFQFKIDSDILTSVQIIYSIYLDGLTKNELYSGLQLNQKCFIYLSSKLTERFGGGDTPHSDVSPMYG